MENSGANNIGTTPQATNVLSSSSATAPNTGGFFSKISWKIWVLIIIVLAFLGFNIFIYLAQGTQEIANILKPITSFLASISKNVINVSAVGTEKAVNTATDVIDSGLNQVQKVTGGTVTAGSIKNDKEEETDDEKKDELNQALDNAATTKPDDIPGDKPTYEADDSYSVIQSSKSASKSGWCYVGEDRGFRTCVEVGENDHCMSGDIFPTKDVCVNPNLRP